MNDEVKVLSTESLPTKDKKRRSVWLVLLIIPIGIVVAGVVALAMLLLNVANSVSVSDEEAMYGINQTLDTIGYSSYSAQAQEHINTADDAFGDSVFTSLIEGEDVYDDLSVKVVDLQKSKGYSCGVTESQVVCRDGNPIITIERISDTATELSIIDKPGMRKTR